MELTTDERLQSLERFARGQSLVMREHGLESMRLDRAEMAAFEKAKQVGYLVCKGHMFRVYELWYAWCTVTQQPFMAINCRRRRAFVELELRDLTAELSDEGLELIGKIFLDKNPIGLPVGHGLDRRACTHTNVPIYKVDEQAHELLRIVKDYLRPAQR